MSANIHEAVIAVMSEVGYVQKEKKAGLNYSFAGEAAFIKAVRPELVKNGIIVHPFAVEEISLEGYETSKGTQMNRTVAKFGYRFVHAPSETSFEVWVLGEGADVGDKDANKAMTAALKYALRQTLLIETGDDPDEQPSGDQERKNVRNWKPEQIKWVVDEKLAQNRHNALAMLNKSVLPIGSQKATVISWARHYREARDNEKPTEEATATANVAYLEAVKKNKEKK